MRPHVRRRDERGTVAIISAISAIVLFGIAAMAVDLGNAYSRARDVQASADFAALAGGTHLPGPATNSSANASSDAVVAVADYLNKNQPLDQGVGACQQTHTCVTAADLVDGSYDNGEVVFSDGGTQMRVYTPAALVKFGLAKIVGVSSVHVLKSAKVGVFSKGAALPYYVGDVCSYGSQQVIDAPPGHDPPASSPDLTPSSANNNNAPGLAVTPDTISAGVPDTIEVSVDPTQVSLGDFSRVGFTQDAADGGAHYAVTISPTAADISSGTISVPVPAAVLGSSSYWYVRLYKPANPHRGWTEDFAVLTVDSPTYSGSCAGANQGNFGSLRLSRDDSNDWNTRLALNTILGLQHNLGTHPDGSSAPTPCDGEPNSVVPTGPPDPGVVNCVQTDTGNPQTATKGLVTGETDSSGTFHHGLIDAAGAGSATTCGKDPGNATSNRTLVLKGTSYQVNDDVLSCYFTDHTVTVGEVSDRNYSGGVVISKDILNSPRFVYLPVLSDDPGTGSKYWPIIGFRAAFITGQVPSATYDYRDPDGTLDDPSADTYNGIRWDTVKGLQTLHFVLINDNALPDTAEYHGAVTRYLGESTKIIRLVD